jgi:hypothetical protein
MVTTSIHTSSKRVKINGQYFALATEESGLPSPIQAYQVNVRADARRFAGQSQRSDNVKVDRWVYPWQRGLGWSRQDRDTGRGYGGLRDADANTIHRVATAPLLPVSTDSSTNTEVDFIQFFLTFEGDLWAFGEETYSASTGDKTNIASVKFQSSDNTWRNGGGKAATADGNGYRVFDAVVHKGKMYIVTNDPVSGGSENQIEVWSTPDGATWSTASGASFTHQDGSIPDANSRRNHWGDHGFAKLLSFGNTLYLAAWAADEELVRVQKTTDAGANWSVITTISLSNPMVGAFVAWRDPFTAGMPAVPVLVLGSGVYKIDDSGTTFAEIFPLPEKWEDGDWFTGSRAAVAADGGLYVPVPGGDLLRLEVPQQGAIVVSNCGPGTHAAGTASDGLVEKRKGNVNAVHGSNSRWLCVAYGENTVASSARYGSILAMDYETKAWHSLYLDPTADRVIHALTLSPEDDGTQRLHWATEATEDAGTTLSQQITNPLADPAAGTSVSYRTGYMQFPNDDLGDPNADSAVMQALVDVENLATSATGVHLEWFYGTTVSAWTTNDAGDFFATVKALQLPAGATAFVGVQTKKLSSHLDLNVAATTASNGPLLLDFEVQARNKVQLLRGFRVPIDISATARQERVQPETVLSRIRTIEDSVVLVEFVFGEDGSDASKIYLVEAVPGTSGELQMVEPESVGLGGRVDQTDRTGVYSLQLEEVYT